MDDLLALFKSSPLEAIGIVIAGGIGYLWKIQKEKKEQIESRGVDAREIERQSKIIDAVTKERDEERDRADAAFAKQLELTERFSEMRAQNEKVLAQMDQLSNQMADVLKENAQLRDKMAQMTEELKTLRATIQESNHQ